MEAQIVYPTFSTDTLEDKLRGLKATYAELQIMKNQVSKQMESLERTIKTIEMQYIEKNQLVLPDFGDF